MKKEILFLLFVILMYSCEQEQEVITEIPLTINNENDYAHKSLVFNNIFIDSLGIYPGNEYKASYYGSNLVVFAQIDDNGVENGIYMEFHDNGNIYIIGYMKNGYYEGEVKTYSKKGLLLKYEVMSNSKIIESLTHPKIDSIVRDGI